ncbi:MAG: hypothetical protein U5N53_28320 [Mycobacterium sp.]|nr:hypothetical protein [Mycobacterium sp.]
MNAPEATAVCEHCAAQIEMRSGIWWHAGLNTLYCAERGGPTAWPAANNAETAPEGFAFEYAIQLGDGSYVTDYGEYHLGEFVATWTDFDAAQAEYFRIRSNGIIPHDESLRNAQLVRRLVPAWSPINFMGYPEVRGTCSSRDRSVTRW